MHSRLGNSTLLCRKTIFFLFLFLYSLIADAAYQTSFADLVTSFDVEDNGVWTLADYTGGGSPDLIYIKTRNTGTGTIEVHISSGSSLFQDRALATGTAFAIQGDGTWLMADYDGDGIADLVYIKNRNTGTGKVEVHVASGASAFQSIVFQTSTGFDLEDNGVWTLSYTGDLVYIKTRNTGSGKIEYFVASKASGYQTLVQGVATDFLIEDNGTWCLSPIVNGPYADLYYIKTRNTGTGTVEVHAVSAASGWQTRVIDTGTAFALDDSGYWLMVDESGQSLPDLAHIKNSNTASGKVEVHIEAP